MSDEIEPSFAVSSWFEAELLAADHMRLLGFEDATTTAGGADGGIDVRASGAVGQVKHYSNAPIGSPSIQRLRGAALRTKRCLFYALNGYTSAAIAYADEATVALFQYDLGGTVWAINEHAEALASSRHVPLNLNLASEARAAFMGQLRDFGQHIADTCTVGTSYVNPLVELDVEELIAGRSGSGFITLENFQRVNAELDAIRQVMAILKSGEERPASELLDLLISFEAVLQGYVSRFDLDYELASQIASDLRREGFFGVDRDDLSDIVHARVTAQSER